MIDNNNNFDSVYNDNKDAYDNDEREYSARENRYRELIRIELAMVKRSKSDERSTLNAIQRYLIKTGFLSVLLF